MNNDPLIILLNQTFGGESRYGEALDFCICWLVLCHFVDDIVDTKKDDHEFLLKTFEHAAITYSLPFYRQHAHTLLPIIKSATNNYADSVLFEHSMHSWQRTYADALRQSGNDVLCAVVEICVGQEKRRIFSQKVREISYMSHHTKEGEVT
jgi:hypothetical protein